MEIYVCVYMFVYLHMCMYVYMYVSVSICVHKYLNFSWEMYYFSPSDEPLNTYILNENLEGPEVSNYR